MCSNNETKFIFMNLGYAFPNRTQAMDNLGDRLFYGAGGLTLRTPNNLIHKLQMLKHLWFCKSVFQP